MASSTAATLKGGQTKDFSGGPNFRDAPPELAANELEDAWNITLDERGGVESRLGYAKYNSTQFDTGSAVVNIWYSPLLSTTVTQAGAKLYLGTSNSVVKTFSSSAIVTFRELNSLLVANHPVDGLFTSPNGTVWTAVGSANAPNGKGTCLEVWQNKLFVGCTDGSVHWSAAGDPTTWASTDFNKLWEHDQLGIVALHVGSGQDILGRPGLLAFKQDSSYRISDSTTGQYTTIDATVGAAGPLAVVGVGARVITISKLGVYWWREDQTQMVNASDQFLPVWDPSQIDFTRQSQWCAGRKGNRAYVSLTLLGSTVNSLAIEFHPDQGWVVPRSDAMSCYATQGGNNTVLYGGSTTVNGQVYTLATGGTDDGAAISWRMQTRWFELNSGFNAIVWQLRLHGRSSGELTFLTNYASGGGNAMPFDLDDAGIDYDSGLDYDAGLDYAIPSFQNTEASFGLGLCRQFSLIFVGSTSTTASGPQIFDQGAPPQVGAFGLYGVEWLFVPLGLS